MNVVTEQFNRIIAEVNMTTSGVSANCEECGVAIPIEYTRCSACSEVSA